MRIAIPIADGKLAMHFGHCEEFALLDTDAAKTTVAPEERVKAPAHEPGLLPRWLAEMGVDLVIAGGMGSRAQTLFAQAGIDVLVGAPGGDPDAVVRAYLDGSLATGENVCEH